MTKGENLVIEIQKIQQILNLLFVRILVEHEVIAPSEMQDRLVEMRDELQEKGAGFATLELLSPLISLLQDRYGTADPRPAS